MSPHRALLPLMLLCLPLTARAKGADDRPQDPCAAGNKDPQRLAETGLRIYKEATALDDPREQVKEYERALRCYQAALGVSQRSAAKLYHPLGLVFEKLDRYVEAVEAFQRFLTEVPESQRNVGVTKQINDKLKALYGRVARLSIDTVPGLEVRVDERPVGRAPLGRLIVVAPGAHIVSVGDPQVGTLGADITVEAGQVHRVDLTGWRPREKEPPPAAQQQTPAAETRADPAFLSVRSNRLGASISVDGRLVGRTPLSGLSIAPGPHDVQARHGREQVATTITLAPRENRAVLLNFPVQPWVWALVGVGAAAVVGTAVGVGVYYGTAVGRPDGVVRF